MKGTNMAAYRVIGGYTVAGVAPGGVVDIDDDRLASRLLRARAVERVDAPSEPTTKAELRQALTGLGVDASASATKAELAALYEEAATDG